jgi:hypothetical protein
MGLWHGRPVRAVERIDDAAEADVRVLQHLASLGCDPSSPRRTTHFVYLRDKAGADAVADVLHRADWMTTIEHCLDDSWLVVAARVTPLSATGVRETRRSLEALAAAHGGVYDGWEARTD